MEPEVTILLTEYEDLKERAERQDIPAEVYGPNVYSTEDGDFLFGELTIKIDMQKLKLKICEQNGIDPSETVVKFY